jgi:hypothetical protein
VDGSIKLRVILRKENVSVGNMNLGVDGKIIATKILKKHATRVCD